MLNILDLFTTSTKTLAIHKPNPPVVVEEPRVIAFKIAVVYWWLRYGASCLSYNPDDTFVDEPTINLTQDLLQANFNAGINNMTVKK